MIEIRPLIQRSGRQIEAKFGVDNWLEYINANPESRYVDIDTSSEMFELINDKKFTGRQIQMLFLINYNQEVVVGFNSPSAYNSWADFLISAENFANYGKSKRAYGIEPLIMEIKSVGQDHLYFTVYNEWDNSIKYIDVTLPTKEFMLSLTRALKHFCVTMIHDYKVAVGDEGIIDRIENLLKRFSN